MTNHRSLPWSLALSCLITAIVGCASAPLEFPKSPSSALTDTGDTSLAAASVQWIGDEANDNGFYPLANGLDAFGARLTLIDRAERSIDAQYFLMKPDQAGLVFGSKLLQAADRGVRVRLLLDDIFTTVDDRAFVLMNEHPNIEVRIFNPIARQGVYAVNYIGNFRLANRRMHNKSFTVDNQVSVVGGRNIAVEYFQLESSGEFIDFDMLCAGPVVKEISASFDTYWNHSLAVPMEALYDHFDVNELEALSRRIGSQMQESGESIYGLAIRTELMQKLNSGQVRPFNAAARLFVDDPQKLLEKVGIEHKVVATNIVAALNNASREAIIYTPYLIPGKNGVEILRRIAAKGVHVVIVTNSLATNNHTAVHSAYSSYRKRLLKAGVDLWEARADAAKVVHVDGTSEREYLTLHSKGIIIDRRQTFVGSLNLDPRSIDINTEMGVMIDSEALGQILAERSIERIPEMAYQLKLDENNRIRWHAVIDGHEIIETKEPQTSAWRRFQAWLLKIAPEKQL